MASISTQNNRRALTKNPHVVFVTGATGFIGNQLVRFLLTQGWKIRTSVRNKRAIEKLPHGVEPVITGDLTTAENLPKAVKDVQVVAHLAARVHIMNDTGPDSALEFQKANLEVTRSLATAAARAGVKRFIFISTVKAFGEFTRPGETWTESTKCKPIDAYSRSKLAAESALFKISEETGLEVVVLRLPLVYGPGVKANFFRLIQATEKGLPLPIATIENQRSLLYVGNLLDAILACLTHPKATNETFLVSDGGGHSTPELVRCIAARLGKPSHLIHLPEKVLRLTGRILHKSTTVGRLLNSLLIDSSKIQRMLDWHPPFTFEEGLTETVNWYKRIKCN